ncbi:hypothetical protein Cgig2_002565 [Carnegiea gigantea]|uniref:Enoyl reductase (ER) domain-containing protein n=1 Tax=Carnegiea gigantea TaxID=171969 RepID=A0A9Q1JG55_9CARY|nr:hypothetical protein Cgig2_002565 [Carnegiea gigantea]
MELKPGLSALVTGGASGIGEALSLALGERGIFVTVLDLSEEKGKHVASLIDKQNAKFHQNLKFPSSMFIRCDVCDKGELSSAFAKHLETYGGLDICINNAGIFTPDLFYKDRTDGSGTWRRTIDVNLVAVIDCTRLAIQAMQGAQRSGVIINVASSAGLYPSPVDPIYSASKGGVVLFTRSLLALKRQGIRVNVLCPEFVETDLGSKVDPKIVNLVGGFIPMEMVVKVVLKKGIHRYLLGTFQLITDESKAGSCLWITNRKGLQYWPTPIEEAQYRVPSSKMRRFTTMDPMNVNLPQSFEKIVVHTLSHNFRAATGIVRAPLTLPIKSNHVVVKVLYAGVNASDVNFSSGRYFGGSSNDLGGKLPFDAGFEAVGIIAALGDSVVDLRIGTPAAVMTFGSYAEFMIVPSKYILPVARPDPEVVAMLTSGLTASIALEKAAQMSSGETVLVTAAAGGTGQFAVQLAKLAGNKVVATCGGKDKAMLLKELGVDRVINYKEEDIKTEITDSQVSLQAAAIVVSFRSLLLLLLLATASLVQPILINRYLDDQVLKKEFPKGVDIIYESVGGTMFDICLNALAVYGRLVVIGMISQYQGEHGWKPSNYPGLCEKLLAKSQTVAGFFLVQYGHLWRQHLEKLFDLYSLGMLKVNLDLKRFVGLHSVADAVEYLHSGKSIGKVVVCIDPNFSQVTAKL